MSAKSKTLKRLNELLHQEQREEEERKEQHLSTTSLEAIQAALRTFQVLPATGDDDDAETSTITDVNEHLRKSMTPLSQLLSLPTCTPSPTTIVPLSSLPKHQRSLLLNKQKFSAHTTGGEDVEDTHALVEIPTAAVAITMSLSDNTTAKSTSVQNRPLAGNLSSKLVEYTRGTVGARRPFSVSGLMEDAKEQRQNEMGEGDVGDNDDDDGDVGGAQYCKIEDIQSAREALTKGSLESWKDGTLLTSPPDVSFQVGLQLSDVFEGVVTEDMPNNNVNSQEGEKNGQEKIVDANLWTSRSNGAVGISGGGAHTSNNFEASKMWDKAFFEEDSLFADSSGCSSSSSLSDDNESENESEDEDKQMKETQHDGQVPNVIDQSSSLEEKDGEYMIEDIDNLLSQMTDQQRSKTKMITNNPLHLAQRKKSNEDRKSWAVTTSLPLNNFHSVVPNPAISYPFELDTFQKQAVARLERGECIFVAAHTSAGKTVCAEYAIALARKHCTRAIYTSPIKALSNQKYRDFKDKFGDDVGLITGDMQINADSSCLIMTTEILRSMLYRGADLVRDIEWVIFDEVHYINDTERGVVWEEVIIMLPDYVNLIFLSATTPNTIDFSDWIGRTKRKPVHVIRTDYRPVPLSHYLYAGLKVHKVMEGKSGFLEKGWKDASMALLPASERERRKEGGKKGTGADGKKGNNGKKPANQSFRKTSGSKHATWQQSGSRQDWTSLVKYLDREGLMPCVCFSFSKKKCEEIANMLQTLNLNTAAESNAVHCFAIQTMKRLSPKDASLPQVVTTCEMVKRGIGIHHGGLLPILKEMVEILFSRNLIKVLFATETFAMGVNMPARAVVFNSIRKHDGTQFRALQPGEYTQMAGRAGRRGLDKVGTVIMCCFGEEPPPQVILRTMLTGTSTKLQSQFRLTYNMILNLLRVEDMTVEGMIKRSFSEFATQRALTTNEYPTLLEKGKKALAKLDKSFEDEMETLIGAEDIGDYYKASTDMLSLSLQTLSYLLSNAGVTAGGALVPGRIILVTADRKKKDCGYVRQPALVISAPVSAVASGGGNTNSKPAICIVLLPASYVPQKNTSKDSNEKELNYIGSSNERYYAIHEIALEEILFPSASKVKIDSKELYAGEASGLPSLSNAFGGAKPVGKKSDDFFGAAKPRGKKNDDDFFGAAKPRGKKNDNDFFANMVPRGAKAAPSKSNDDFFSGMVPRGKKGSQKNFGAGNTGQTIDRVVKSLIEAEDSEAKSSLRVMDMKECAKGIRQGDEALEFQSTCNKFHNLISLVRQHEAHYHPNLEKHYFTVARKETLRGTIKTLQHLLSNESLQLFPDFLQRKDLLKTLNYIDENDTVCIKGRVACEVNTCEELIATEMVFEGVLNDLEPAEIVAALSALIFQEKSNDEELDSELPERLLNVCQQMKKIARNLGQLQQDHGLRIDPYEYCDNSMKFGIVHVVYEWALGVPFSNICELTLVQEGSIVRSITRLDELCREVRNCARVVGNPTLYRKMEEASAAIKRDIVFASSLYVT